jgi:simple sugar transport system permease protein
LKIRLLALVAASLAVLIAAILIAGESPVEALTTLVRGSLGSARGVTGTLRETTPLLMTGLAVYIALRSGLFNIGVEGQFVVGALAAAASQVLLGAQGGWVVAPFAAVAAGALWSLPAGLIRAYRNGHEVITTIMLNNVALLMATALVSGPLRDRTQVSPSTARLGTPLPNLLNTGELRVNAALAVGLILAVAAWLWLRRTVAGYELQLVGQNPIAAQFAGVQPRRTMVGAMVASGAIAGLGGAMQVMAYEGRFYSGFSAGYGFDGLGIALLAGNNPLAVIPGALLFGVLARGGVSLGIEGIPKGITTVVIGLVILIGAAIRYRQVNRDA